jgi:hypothetical protein
MAATYILISSQVLGSTTTAVTFSSIPQTYKDLKLVYSTRSPNAQADVQDQLIFNGDTTQLYSYTIFYNPSGTPSVTVGANQYVTYPGTSVAGSSTANTFGNSEIYIPNYTSASSKQILNYGTSETNSVSGLSYAQNLEATLYRGAAVTSFVLTGRAGGFVANSSFYLYGIKSS